MTIAKRVLLALTVTAGSGTLFAAGLPSAATDAMMDSAKEQAVDMAKDQAKEQLMGKDTA